MDLATFRALLTPLGQRALAEASSFQPREEDFLRLYNYLSRRYPTDLARAALETAILRRRAGVKFPHAERLYFTRPALEQATPHEVASYRAKRLASFERLADLGCSVGGDTLALAAVAPTVGIDQDPLRLAMAAQNLRALDLSERAVLIRADLHHGLPLQPHPSLALFFDPDRRDQEGRRLSVNDYRPSLNAINEWLKSYAALAVKVSPAVDLEEVRSFEAEIEFISLRGALKEATLWFGPLKSALRRATVLPGDHTMAVDDQRQLNSLPQPRLSEPQAYLYEPDPAVIRAGLVAELAARLNACQLDSDIAYLTGERWVETPFARCWVVETWMPFNLKQLRAWLRRHNIGRLVVKKRGSPLTPEGLLRQLGFVKEAPNSEQRMLFLTHLRGRPVVIICFPSQDAPHSPLL